jgi:glutathione S-transferase
MNPLILHHYPVSPFAEKVRAMLGFKGVAWKSVLIPMMMPKPDVVALTGGYRRTPILQIGADIYCDTSLIARVLERAAPAPTLFPYGDRLEGRAMSHFADSVLFNITVPVGFQPGGMMKLFHPEMTPDTLAEFARTARRCDRAGRCAAGRSRSAGRTWPSCCPRSKRSWQRDRSCLARARASATSRCITCFGRCGRCLPRGRFSSRTRKP